MLNKSSLIAIGRGASIIKLQTSVSVLLAGVGSDLWVDMQPVPSGYVRLIQAVSQTRDSTFTGAEEVSCFVCDSTMNPLNSPVDANTGRVNFAQLGAFIGALFPFGTNPLSISAAQPVGFVAVLASQQFLRFVTASLTPAQFPNVGDFANIQVFYSDISICE
jgi:hypothetical protein